MTDREKLVELIEYFTEHMPHEEGQTWEEACANHLFANGLTFETDTNDGGKWISAKDRLPDAWMDVLTHRTGGDLCVEFKCSGDGWALDDYMLGEVTHWMPMPEPPKED